MPPSVLALAVALAVGPPLTAWLVGRAERGWARVGLALLAAVGIGALLWWVGGPIVEAAMIAHRDDFQRGEGAPYDWAGLDQAGRRAVLDAIEARLARGRLLAGTRAAAVALGAAFAGAVIVRFAYRRLLAGSAEWHEDATHDPP